MSVNLVYGLPDPWTGLDWPKQQQYADRKHLATTPTVETCNICLKCSVLTERSVEDFIILHC